MITALMVLKARPLALNQPGPTITLSSSDVAIYSSYVARDGSVVIVKNGEQISEYQMLEAMLLPSANNMADSLATWAYGSLPNYTASANSYLHSELGLVQTTVGSDASGFTPNTVSTAQDLVKIGELVMQNPVLAQIVGETRASNFPLVGNIKNYNSLLGSNNVIGIKTGNTDQAGGVYVAAAKTVVVNKPVIVVSAEVGAPTLQAAINDSLPLIKSAQTNFTSLTLLNNGLVVGEYKIPWQSQAVEADSNKLMATVWAGSTVTPKAFLDSLHYPAKTTAGSVKASGIGAISSSPSTIFLKEPVAKPSIWWRFTHP